MTIRPATAADLPQLVVLFRQQAEYQRQLSAYFQLQEDGDLDGFLADRIGSSSARIFVAQHDDALIGYIVVRIIQQRASTANRSWLSRLRRLLGRYRAPEATLFQPRRYGFVEDWYVVPPRRGEGVGTALWNASRQWFHDNQVREVEATILTANQLAQRQFHHLGFEAVRVLVQKQLG